MRIDVVKSFSISFFGIVGLWSCVPVDNSQKTIEFAMEEGFLTSKPEVELMISNAIVVDGNMSYTWNGQPVTVSEMDSFRKEMDSFDPRPFLELTITDDLNLSQKKEVLKTISVIFQCSKEYDCYFYAAP